MIPKVWSVYVLRNKVTGLRYVGQTQRNVKNRLIEHFKHKRSGNGKLNEAIREHGAENFELLYVIELEKKQSTQELDALERDVIQTLDTFSNGYNDTQGGSGKPVLTRTGANRTFFPPVNVKATTIYLTPDQHAKVVRLAQQETDKLAARLGDVNMNKPPRVSVSDFIRTLIDRQPL